jgi:hypothetical protein
MSDVLGNSEVKQRKRPGPKPKQRDVEGMTNRDIDQGGLALDPRESAAHESGRPKRVSMQGAMKLGIPEGLAKEGHTVRWFRDKDGRIAQAQAAYWEHIKSDGKNLSRQSGPYTMYAMQLANEYVQEDRALKRDKIAARIKQEAAVGANEYTDNGNNSAISSVESGNPFK